MRGTVADFAVFISILVWTGIDIALKLDTPKLTVPTEFKTTLDGRGWLVNPLALLPEWYLILLAFIPALLATILIFLDQQITAVIVNRKEHKLKVWASIDMWLIFTVVVTLGQGKTVCWTFHCIFHNGQCM